MAGPRLSLLNLARAMKVAALLCFLLPWATVSCSSGRLTEAAEFEISGAPSETIALPTGIGLATGSVRMLQEPPSAGEAPPANPFARPDPFTIAGAVLILAAFALTFVRRALLAALGAALLAGGALCYAILVRLPRTAHDYTAAMISGDTRLEPGQLLQMLEVRIEPGFWLTLLALAAAVALLIADRFRLPA